MMTCMGKSSMIAGEEDQPFLHIQQLQSGWEYISGVNL